MTKNEKMVAELIDKTFLVAAVRKINILVIWYTLLKLARTLDVTDEAKARKVFGATLAKEQKQYEKDKKAYQKKLDVEFDASKG